MADPNLTFDLDDLGVKGPGDQAGQAVGSAAHQKSVPAHSMRHRVRRGQEIHFVSNLGEHVWVLYRQ